jgi:hypothetical protein
MSGKKGKRTLSIGDTYTTPDTKEPQNPPTPEPAAPKPPKVTTVDIVCVDCGATRTIGKGEAFQVKRCEPCQLKHRKALRKQYRKERKDKQKNRIALLEALLRENGIGVPA